MLLQLYEESLKTRAVGDQQGGDLAIEIEWKTAPAAEAKKVIGKKNLHYRGLEEVFQSQKVLDYKWQHL